MATAKGDIQLNAKDYLLTAGGYHITESYRTRPNAATEPRTLSTFEHQNNWRYFGQSGWAGMGHPKFLGDGPFFDGYGLDLGASGECRIAKRLVIDKVDAANTDGYVGFRIGAAGVADRVIFGGRTNGTSFSKNADTGVWTDTVNALGAGVFFRSHGFFNSTTHIGASNGHVFTTNDGITYTDKGTPGPTTDAMILGSVKGKMYVGYVNGSIFTFDPTGASANFVAANTFIDQHPFVGASGSNGLYIITAGPYPRVLFTDGTSLLQITSINTDFTPEAAVFLNRLYLFGRQSSGTTPKGAVWALGAEGLEELFTFGDGTIDQGIRSAQIEGQFVLWTATGAAQSGIGVFDQQLDISDTEALGFYVNSTTAAAGVIHGLAEAKGLRYCGMRGSGIFKQDTPGVFRLKAGLYGGDSRNIQKYWGQAEIRHTALVAGQSVTVKSTKNPTDAEDTWGTGSTVGATLSTIPAPADYRTPFLSYILSGDAGGTAMTVYDAAFAYIRMADPSAVKREWRVTIAVEGTTAQPQYMRDGIANTRTGLTMLSELNGLWNTKTTFQDIDGATYTVLVKAPDALPAAGSRRSGELDRRVTGGLVDRLSLAYDLQLVEL